MMDFEVHIHRVDHGEVANQLHGYIIMGEDRLRFSAIAFGRFGGQNVSPRLSKKVAARLKEKGVDLEEFVTSLQRKIVEGDVMIEAKPPKTD